MDTQTRCFVKVRSTDDWAELNKRDPDKSFIKFCPDLSLTPATRTTAPPNIAEVNKRLRSEEGRINSRQKMRDLFDLRDKIYTVRSDQFHWDLSSCIELRSWNAINDDGNHDLGEHEHEESNDYEYEINTFVALHESSQARSFWVGRVVDVLSTSRLLVHWYEPPSSGDPYMSKYTASYIMDASRKRQVPWIDEVPGNSVISSFDSLTKSKTLPVAVRKQILEYTSTLGGNQRNQV